MTNKTVENIQAIKESLLSGDNYGILIYDKPSKFADYNNVYEIDSLKEYGDDLHIYYKKDNKVFGLSLKRDIYDSFLLLPLIGYLDEEPLYTGQIASYKGVDVSVTYQDQGVVYFLDVDTNDLFGMAVEKFDDHYYEGNLIIKKEFQQEKEIVEKEFEKGVVRLSDTLKNVSQAKTLESATPEVEESSTVEQKLEKDFEEYDDVSIAKIGERFVYICKDTDRTQFDIIEVVFIGAITINEKNKYKRKTVSVIQLNRMIESKELEFATPNELMEYARKVVGG